MLNKINLYDCNKSLNAKTHIRAKALSSSAPSQKNTDLGFKSLYAAGGVSFCGAIFNANTIDAVSGISHSVISSANAYRAKLAEAVGVKTESLISILAPEELKAILHRAKPENFASGNDFENVLNGIFHINLHMHTKHSDGKLSVEELLSQAAKYAEYRKSISKNEPVVVGITDHDSIEGAKEAVRLIAANPEKYKDIRVVLGVELNAEYASRQVEAIAYCINPFEKNLSRYMDAGREFNKQYLNSFVKTVNHWEEKAGIPLKKRITLNSVIEHAEKNNLDCNKQIKFFGSAGMMKGFFTSLKDIFNSRGWRLDGINNFENNHISKYKSLYLNPSTPELIALPKIIERSDSGFVGIAHPCRNLGGLDLRSVFADFKNIGIEAAEVHYQYPENNIHFPKSFQDHVDLAASLNGMIKSGGHDNHTDNIFTNKLKFSELPERVQTAMGHFSTKDFISTYAFKTAG